MSRKLIRNIYIKDLQAAPDLEWFTEKDRKHADIARDAMRDNGAVIQDEFEVPINDIQLVEFLNKHARLHPCAKTKIGR